MNKEETYTPTIVEETKTTAYALFMLEVANCPTCGKWMLEADERWLHKMFPKYFKQKADRQLAAAGMVLMSASKNKDDVYICVECSAKGLANFECSLCKQIRESSLVKEQYGDPSSYLCSVCYENVTAKAWEEFQDKLREAHRYDYC